MKTPTHEKKSVQQIDCNKLFEEIRGFKPNKHVPHKEFYAQLSQYQNPHTLFISYSDSRVIPNLLTPFRANCLLYVTLAILCPFMIGGSDTFVTTSAVIEYAVKQLQVTNIVVCGHSNCGDGYVALYSSEKDMKHLPHTKKCLELAAPVKKIVEEKIAKKKISIKERSA